MNLGNYKSPDNKYYRLYHLYREIYNKCYDPNNRRYYNTGALGARICSDWYTPSYRNDTAPVERFMKWCIDNGWQEGMTIIRWVPDKDYSPDNCGIVTRGFANKYKYDPVDHIGETFTNWTIIDGPKIFGGYKQFLCRCKCGTEKWIPYSRLKDGSTKSCGCYNVTSHIKHGFTSSTSKNKRLYKTLDHMISRCYNPRDIHYAGYGGSGIRISPEWYTPEDLNIGRARFFEWAWANGYDDTLTIDRIDPHKNYGPDNCRWITMAAQQLNKSNTRYINDGSEIIPFKLMEDKYGMKSSWISSHLHDGWSANAVVYAMKHKEDNVYKVKHLRRDEKGLPDEYRDQDGFLCLIPRYDKDK